MDPKPVLIWEETGCSLVLAGQNVESLIKIISFYLLIEPCLIKRILSARLTNADERRRNIAWSQTWMTKQETLR